MTKKLEEGNWEKGPGRKCKETAASTEFDKAYQHDMNAPRQKFNGLNVFLELSPRRLCR